MNRLRLLLSESVGSLINNLSTTLAAAVTVLIGMFLLGLVIGFGTWVLSWSHHVKQELAVRVYFCRQDAPGCSRDASLKQENNVARLVTSWPNVRRIVVVTKEQALAQERKAHPDLTATLPQNPFPDMIQIVPKSGDSVFTIKNRLQPLPPGVQKVTAGGPTTRRIIRFAKVVEIVFGIAVLLLLTSATLLIGNTIRLSIFSRRREIEVMKLVGATNWFIRGPFMLEGLLCGVTGAVAAVLLLLLGKEIALPAILGHLGGGPGVHAWPFAVNALILLGAGLLLGAAGSGLTLRRFLRI